MTRLLSAVAWHGVFCLASMHHLGLYCCLHLRSCDVLCFYHIISYHIYLISYLSHIYLISHIISISCWCFSFSDVMCVLDRHCQLCFFEKPRWAYACILHTQTATITIQKRKPMPCHAMEKPTQENLRIALRHLDMAYVYICLYECIHLQICWCMRIWHFLCWWLILSCVVLFKWWFLHQDELKKWNTEQFQTQTEKRERTTQ